MKRHNSLMNFVEAISFMYRGQRRQSCKFIREASSMKRSISPMQATQGTTLILALSMAMSSCAQLNGLVGDSWKEEVLLHDGQKLVVTRSQTYGGRREVGQSPPVRQHSIEFRLPDSSNTIKWTSEFGDDLGRTNFQPVALHVLGRVPYLVAVPNLCVSYNKWGRPNPPYVIFKREANEWMRIALSEFPREFREINLAIETHITSVDVLSSKSLVTAAFVKEWNATLEQPEYKTILREPIEKAHYGSSIHCPELVYYKCGWGSPSELNRKYFESVCK
jgi:hypothetical protein